MKRMFVICLVLTCLCIAAGALADNSTVANAPKNLTTPTLTGAPHSDDPAKQLSQDMDYIRLQKRMGLFRPDDPTYLRVLEAARQSASTDHGNSLDQGSDTCPATVIGALPYADSGTTAGMAADVGGCVGLSPDVIYAYTAGANSLVAVSLQGSSYDTQIIVLTGGACPGATQIACNDDYFGLQSYLEFCAAAGHTYYIVVSGFFGSNGAYTLNVTNLGQCTPPCIVDYSLAAPGSVSGSTIGDIDDCGLRSGADDIIEVSIPYAGNWTFSLCDPVNNWDSYMYLGTGCCVGDISQDDDACPEFGVGFSLIQCVTLNAGTYYVDIEGFSGQTGDYTLQVIACTPPQTGRCCYQGSCYENVDIAYCASLGGVPGSVGSTCTSEPCPPPPPPPGTLRVITVPVPCGLGVSIAADCRGDLYYTCYGGGVLYQMDAFGNLLSSHPIVDASGNTIYIDEIGWDEGRQVFWGGELNTDAIWTVDRLGNATYQFVGQTGGFGLTDGCDYDGTDGTIWHSTDVSATIAHFNATGLLLGNLTLYDEFGNPEGTISGVEMGANNTIFAGNSPIDDVRRCDKTTGAFVSRFDAGQVRCEGMECDAINFAPLTALWVKDAYNNTVTAFQIDAGTCVCAELPDTCQVPYELIDDGDLQACNYPTLHANPGHGLSDVAWLGQCVNGEPAPNSLDLDGCDDGVVYNGLPWMPCTPVTVTVTVTGGAQYTRYEHCGGHLYLNGWKDGNLDGDFCDEISCAGATASEWLVHDVLVTPGVFNFTFIDPGVLDIGVYDGVFRWRLTSTPVGRNGFGLAATQCQNQCGTFGFDFLGEVEDYVVNDAQLAVDLSSFTAVGSASSIALHWTTASERNNDHFEVLRNGTLVRTQVSSGNTSSGSTYEWVDGNVEMGHTYTYTLVAVDGNGQREELGTVESSPNANAVVVTEYALHQNFPNPFNPSTTITFDLVASGNVSLKVFNLVGQEVATLVNGNLSSGRHTLNFTAAGLPSGLYLYKLEADGFSAQKKMLLMK